MEGEKSITKIVEEKVNTEDLIHEVEKRPAVWDPSTEDYSNKTERRNAWNDIILHFIPDFEGKSPAEKNEIAAQVQKKWKGIHSCYTRELMRKKNEKSGSSASGRKQYVYFEILRFLETVSKRTASNMDGNTDQDAGNEDVQEVDLETQKETGETEKRRKHSRMRKNNDDDELIQVLKIKILHENQQASDETNEDRLFLLSLVSELQKVPTDRKLKVKLDIIATIAQAQQVYQQMPQYPQYPVYHPTHPLQGFHHAQQPTFHGGHHSQYNPIPSGSAPVQSTHTPTPAPSPDFSEASSVMSDCVGFEQ